MGIDMRPTGAAPAPSWAAGVGLPGSLLPTCRASAGCRPERRIANRGHAPEVAASLCRSDGRTDGHADGQPDMEMRRTS